MSERSPLTLLNAWTQLKLPPPHFPGSLKALKFLRAATADYFTQLSQHRGNEVMPPVSYVLCSPLLPFFSHSLKLCTTALWLSCRRESREATKGQCLSSQGRYRGNLSDWSINIPPLHHYSEKVEISDIQPSTAAPPYQTHPPLTLNHKSTPPPPFPPL